MTNTGPYTFSWDSEKKHDGTTYPVDTLDRARYASFLTNFLIAEASNGGYVLNINAPWGTGKTYFLNRWLIDLKEKHPVVYIDAWKQDFSNDPMLSVVSSIINQLQALLPKEDKTISDTLGKVNELMKGIAPIVAKGLMKKAIGVDLLSSNDNTDEMDLSKSDEAMLGDIAAKVTDKMIKNHNSTLNSISTFKIAIKEWIKAIQVKSDLDSPTFIFIDELDRCRPTYAVQMLEVIKHFFEMDNIIFVVATDTDQLQHAIKAVYGQGFEAQTYLGRFFNRRCTLQSVSKVHFVNNYLARTSMSKISNLSEIKSWPQLRDEQDLGTLIVQLDYLYDFSLRELEQLIDKVIAIVLIAEAELNLIFLVYLLMVYEKDKVLFNYLMKINSFKNLEHTDKGLIIIKHIGAFTFNFDFKDTYVYLQKSEPINNTSHQLTLVNILIEVYESFKLSKIRREQKTSELKDIKHPSQIINPEHKKSVLAQHIYANTIKIKSYKNWIELAVSFDA